MTCIATCGGGLTVLFGFAWKPESMPPAMATQGEVKADWVTVWFVLMKVKTTMSPTAALICEGVYARPAVPPTMTWCVAAAAGAAAAAEATAAGGAATAAPVAAAAGAAPAPPGGLTVVVAAPLPGLTQRMMTSVAALEETPRPDRPRAWSSAASVFACGLRAVNRPPLLAGYAF